MKTQKTDAVRIDPDDCHMAEAARNALDDVLSRDPVCMLIMYETNGQFGYASVPASSSVVHGLYIHLGGMIIPELTED
jgi:hypothetical protein